MKIENRGMFITSIFYAFAGVIFLVLLPMSGFPPHIAILGIISLITAYGLFRKRAWSIWFVIILFFAGTTFAAFMIYSLFVGEYVAGFIVLAYLILTWIFAAYVLAKRRNLESQVA